ncbi:follistatin-A-like isoform X1 [Lampetra fluviatilis]
MSSQKVATVKVFLGAFLVFAFIANHPSHAGNCWLQQSKNGRCRELLKMNVSQQECCRSGRLGSAYTGEQVSTATLFRWMAFSGGAPNCKPCKETCDNVDCGPGKQCRMSRRNKPRCVCAPDCSNASRSSVCGTDGKTYRDGCALLKARCKGQANLEMQYHGPCQKNCKDVQCPSGTFCVVDQNNNAHCVLCNLRPCPADSGQGEQQQQQQHVCGKDGVTYASVCNLRRATCLLGKSIGVAYQGRCSKSKSCDDVLCGSGKKCLWDPAEGGPHCAQCNDICRDAKRMEPVCATNNNTYPNACAMSNAACSSGIYLEVKHTGYCSAISEEEEEDNDDVDMNTFPKPIFHNW